MMALPAFELDSFKMESLQPKSDMNLFKTFKNSYEDVRLGAVGFLDYKVRRWMA